MWTGNEACRLGTRLQKTFHLVQFSTFISDEASLPAPPPPPLPTLFGCRKVKLSLLHQRRDSGFGTVCCDYSGPMMSPRTQAFHAVFFLSRSRDFFHGCEKKKLRGRPGFEATYDVMDVMSAELELGAQEIG